MVNWVRDYWVILVGWLVGVGYCASEIGSPWVRRRSNW